MLSSHNIKEYIHLLHYYCVKKLYKAFCGSKGSSVKSDKLPPVMSLQSVSVGSEDYKFENNKKKKEKKKKSPHHHLRLARGYINCY